MRVQGFVIHLARAKQRSPLVERILAVSPVETQIFDAVDGREMSEADLRAWYSATPLHSPKYPFTLGVGEVACFLSHQAIWRKMVHDGIDFALILEDDVEMDATQVGRVVEFVVGVGNPDVYVELQTRPLPACDIVAQAEGVQILRPILPPLRTSAQIVGRGAAARLLEVSERFDRPIDCLLQLVSVTGQEVLCASPSGVSDASDEVGGSVAQGRSRRGPSEWLLREWRRFWYRRQVRRLAIKSSGQQA